MTEEMEIETLDHRDFDAEIEEIIDLIREKRYAKVRSTLIEKNAVDIAEILEEVEDELGLESEILIFRMLPKDVSVRPAAAVFLKKDYFSCKYRMMMVE